MGIGIGIGICIGIGSLSESHERLIDEDETVAVNSRKTKLVGLSGIIIVQRRNRIRTRQCIDFAEEYLRIG